VCVCVCMSKSHTFMTAESSITSGI